MNKLLLVTKGNNWYLGYFCFVFCEIGILFYLVSIFNITRRVIGNLYSIGEMYHLIVGDKVSLSIWGFRRIFFLFVGVPMWKKVISFFIFLRFLVHLFFIFPLLK